MKRFFIAVIFITIFLCSALCFTACGSGSTQHTHSYKLVATTQPTCTVNGKNVYKCSCGEGYETMAQAALGHDFDLGKTIEPTCDREGGRQFKCRVCSYSYIDKSTVIPALDHSYTFARKVEPKCKEQGYDLLVCSHCGKTMQTNFRPELGHSPVADEGYAATCLKTGLSDGSHCDNCGNTLQPQLTLPKIDHEDNDINGYCDECSVFVREIKYVNSIADLKGIINDMGGTYVLQADLVLDEAWNGLGTLREAFTGWFYGNGHKIKGLSITANSDSPKGLFVVNRGVIDGLTLENVTIEGVVASEGGGTQFVYGGLTAYNYGTIRNCKIGGYNVFGSSNSWKLLAQNVKYYTFTTGGFAASNYGKIENCRAEGTVETSFYVKCVFQQTNFLVIETEDWASNTSVVSFGLICGYNNGTITDSAVDCVQNIGFSAVTELTKSGRATAVMTSYSGSFVGNNISIIQNCSARACSFNPQKSEASAGCTSTINIGNVERYSGIIGSDSGSIDGLVILI